MRRWQKVMNHIDSNARSIRELLSQRYIVQYYQREYSWGTKQIQELIEDLTNAFYDNYEEGHTQRDVKEYEGYFLGPVILTKEGAIIDGQQRLSTITLLLIYLNHLQANFERKINLDTLLFSEQYGEKTFTINVEERVHCLEQLYTNNDYVIQETDNESVANLANRYKDIENIFPEEMDEDSILVFIEWMKEKVVLVEIVTMSEQDAHKVFVAMNDRGLRLTPVEMLKGYLLSEIQYDDDRNKLNDLWKEKIIQLKEVEKDGDADFVKNWLRAQYAETQRQRKREAKNLDYETIGEAPHKWLRENSTRIGLIQSKDFNQFIAEDFVLFADIYIRLKKYSTEFHKEYEHVFYNAHRNFTLQTQLILAAIDVKDSEDTINKKIKVMSRFIDQFIARRVFNFRSMNYSTILYTIFNVTKEVRNQPVEVLLDIVINHLTNMGMDLNAIKEFNLNQYTKRFIFHKLARMTTYIENSVGMNTRFEDYINRKQKNPYDIEHILPNTYTEETMQEWFESEEEFEESRQFFGALVLLPSDKNRSYQAMPYIDKVEKYDSENLLARTLHENCYVNNPSFLRWMREEELPFKAYTRFSITEIKERQDLYQYICEKIWSLDVINNDL